MNSHAHVILELPAPKEVSMIWDLNLSDSFSSQRFSRFTRSRDRQSATNTPSYRLSMLSWFSLFLFTSTASCATLPVHRSSPALDAVGLKVQIPMLRTTVWYFMTTRAPHRGSLIAITPRTVQIRELPAPKEVSILWRERDFEDLKYCRYESSFIFFKFQWFGGSIPNEFRERERERERGRERRLKI